MNKVVLIILFISFSVFSQSENDTREFLRDVFQANYQEAFDPSYLIFSNNVRKIDAEGICGRDLSDDEFDNLLIYAFEIQIGITESEIISFAESIDIRDIRKVSAIKGDEGNYLIIAYLNGNYPSSRTVNNSKTKNKRYLDGLDKLNIPLGPNKEAALKIKKALMHLGKLRGIDIKDGNLF